MSAPLPRNIEPPASCSNCGEWLKPGEVELCGACLACPDEWSFNARANLALFTEREAPRNEWLIRQEEKRGIIALQDHQDEDYVCPYCGKVNCNRSNRDCITLVPRDRK
jgi:hypothetical protein